MANQDDVITSLVTIGKMLAPSISVVVLVFMLYQILATFRVRSGGNEWLLVMRSGKLIR